VSIQIIVEDGTGMPDSNSYVDVSDVDAAAPIGPYASAKWPTLDSDQKANTMISATAYLDALIVWNGYPLVATQSLEWPRYGVVRYTGPSTPPDTMWPGWPMLPQPVPVTGVPPEVKQAQTQLCLCLAEGSWVPIGAQTVPAASPGGAPVQHMSIGGGAIDLSFDTNITNRVAPSGTVLPPLIQALLVPLYGYAVGGGTFWQSKVFQGG